MSAVTALHTQLITIALSVVVVTFLLLWLPALYTHWRVSRRARRRIGWYT